MMKAMKAKPVKKEAMTKAQDMVQDKKLIAKMIKDKMSKPKKATMSGYK